jgi:hypothetical protein
MPKERRFVHGQPQRSQARDVASTTGRAMTEAIGDVSAKVKKAIDAIRKPFTSFVADFAALAVSREELAPKFMKAFGLWQSETGGTFVEFCRVLVPEIGTTRQEYRNHRAYQAADYLRRLVANAERAARSPEERTQRVQNAPVSHVTAVARLLRTLLPLVTHEATNTMWMALRSQLNWSDRMVTRMQQETQHVEPLVVVREPRGLHALGQLRLAMPAVQAQSQEEEEPEAVRATG